MREVCTRNANLVMIHATSRRTHSDLSNRKNRNYHTEHSGVCSNTLKVPKTEKTTVIELRPKTEF